MKLFVIKKLSTKNVSILHIYRPKEARKRVKLSKSNPENSLIETLYLLFLYHYVTFRKQIVTSTLLCIGPIKEYPTRYRI